MAEPVIVSDPEIMSGIPCFCGTRVPFKNLIDYLEGGHSLGEFIRQFPTVTREIAIQALEEAKESLLSKIAVDQGIRHQQNLVSQKISIIVIRSKTNQIEDLLPFVHPILNALRTITPRQIVPLE
jgi:uncharacterized protein (DUF433 family)